MMSSGLLHLVLFSVVLTKYIQADSGSNPVISLPPKHPCDRVCDGVAMECEYTFDVKWRHTMSEFCGDCNLNGTGCNTPGCIQADGRLRAVMVVNDMMPGPMIMVCHNDVIKVTVNNKLLGAEAITIHWHGIHNRDTQYMDGAEMITQCPITRGGSFAYEFKANPTGTHWWHAHTSMHRGEGIHGALIVKSSSDVNADQFDVDSSDHVSIISDWSKDLFVPRIIKFIETGIFFFPDNILVNGIGYTNVTKDNVGFRNVFTVKAGLRHRFRFISNSVVLCPVEISVDQHKLRVISLDGADIIPYDVTNVIVRSGERVDFVINADQPDGNYWFRFVTTSSIECSSTHYAYLNYEEVSKDVVPTSTAWDPSNPEFKRLNPVNVPEDEKNIYVTSMRPKHSDVFVEDTKLDGTPDEVHFLGMGIIGRDRTEINNITNKIPTSPLISHPDAVDSLCNPENSAMDMTPFCNNGMCVCNHIIDIPLGNVVDLVIYDLSRIPPISGHTLHLHGYHFSVLKMDVVGGGRLYGTKVKEIYNNLQLNGSQSIRKDMVTAPVSGYAVVRFVADNPGVWQFHCHFSFHGAVGMSVSLRVGYPDNIPAPPENFPTCGPREHQEPAPTTQPAQTTSSAARKNLLHLLPLVAIILYGSFLTSEF